MGVVFHEQGEGGAVGIPKGIEIVPVVALPRAWVLAPLVGGHEQDVVEGGVEDALLAFVAVVGHAREHVVPLLQGGSALGVEALRSDVAPRLKRRYAGDAHLAHVDGGRARLLPLQERCAGVALDDGERPVGLQAEENFVCLAIVPPAAHAGPAAQFPIADDAYLTAHALLRLALVGDGVHAQERGGVEPQKVAAGEAVDGAAAGGGDFGVDAVGKGAGVVGGQYFLGGSFGEIGGYFENGTVGVEHARSGGLVAEGEWLQQHVAIFLSAARSAHVCLRETLNPRRHFRPSRIGHGLGVGTGLCHAEGSTGTHEHASQSLRADARNHVLRETVGAEPQG